MIKLEPYKRNAPCPKCGGKEINTTYHAKGDDEAFSVKLCHRREFNMITIGEHLHRKCSCCKYEWLEKVKEIKKQ